MQEYNIIIKEWVFLYIKETWEYIYRFSFSRKIADEFVKNIMNKIFSLKIFPNRFPMFNQKYRVFTIDKKFRVFYQVDDENKKVIINQIFSSYENYDEKFFNI